MDNKILAWLEDIQKSIDEIFDFLPKERNFTEYKKELITKLAQSIDSEESNARNFSSCFGAWQDTRSAEEIINEINSERININEIENF